MSTLIPRRSTYTKTPWNGRFWSTKRGEEDRPPRPKFPKLRELFERNGPPKWRFALSTAPRWVGRMPICLRAREWRGKRIVVPTGLSKQDLEGNYFIQTVTATLRPRTLISLTSHPTVTVTEYLLLWYWRWDDAVSEINVRAWDSRSANCAPTNNII